MALPSPPPTLIDGRYYIIRAKSPYEYGLADRDLANHDILGLWVAARDHFRCSLTSNDPASWMEGVDVPHKGCFVPGKYATVLSEWTDSCPASHPSPSGRLTYRMSLMEFSSALLAHRESVAVANHADNLRSMAAECAYITSMFGPAAKSVNPATFWKNSLLVTAQSRLTNTFANLKGVLTDTSFTARRIVHSLYNLPSPLTVRAVRQGRASLFNSRFPPGPALQFDVPRFPCLRCNFAGALFPGSAVDVGPLVAEIAFADTENTSDLCAVYLPPEHVDAKHIFPFYSACHPHGFYTSAYHTFCLGSHDASIRRAVLEGRCADAVALFDSVIHLPTLHEVQLHHKNGTHNPATCTVCGKETTRYTNINADAVCCMSAACSKPGPWGLVSASTPTKTCDICGFSEHTDSCGPHPDCPTLNACRLCVQFAIPSSIPLPAPTQESVHVLPESPPSPTRSPRKRRRPSPRRVAAG